MTVFETQVNHHMDASGLLCPEPVMMLHGKVQEIPAGELLVVTATDPSTKRDIPNFCRFLGHELVDNLQKNQSYYYLIRKRL